MLCRALVFPVLLLVAGLPGFTGVGGEAVSIARILYHVFLVVFVVSLLYSFITGGSVSGRSFEWSAPLQDAEWRMWGPFRCNSGGGPVHSVQE